MGRRIREKTIRKMNEIILHDEPIIPVPIFFEPKTNLQRDEAKKLVMES